MTAIAPPGGDQQPLALTEKVSEEIGGGADEDTLPKAHTRVSAPTSNKSSEGATPQKTAAAGAADGDSDKHPLLDSWTFWYVYSMSHQEKKKIKQVRRNEYELREVYSFESVSDPSLPTDSLSVCVDRGLLVHV